MVKVETFANSFWIGNEAQKMCFPKGSVIFIADKEKSDSITARLIASRRNIMTFSCKEIGYDNVVSAIDYLESITN